MDPFILASQSRKQWEESFKAAYNLPPDVEKKIEDLMEILEYIENWEPSDASMIANNSCGTAWHDGCS